jgi:VWFA-related protein
MEMDMQKRIIIALLILLSTAPVFSQQKPQKPADEQPIRISTELVQIDVVVTDKRGQIVRGLTKDDFELYESGKKQLINFFEFVEAGKGRQTAGGGAKETTPQVTPPTGLTEPDVRRIFAFVVDDLTIRFEDLVYTRQMLTNFVDAQMQPNDLVAIVRTVGGKGLLQQFTSDKQLLHRAIDALTPSPHPFSAFNNPTAEKLPANINSFLIGGSAGGATSGADVLGESADISSAVDETNKLLRSYMSLGTASFVVDSLRQLPGRKSLILISGGLPLLSGRQGSVAGNVSYFLNLLTDKATRAGVAIHTMDIRGLDAQSAVASFADTPGRSALGGASINGAFGRAPDEALFGYKNPFDTTEGQQGLRALAYATGGIPVLNKNDFNEGLGKILAASEGYYLLAYTPIDSKFDGNFRKLEVKVKGDDLRVHSRRGYLAREEAQAETPTTKQEQLLAAIRSPLARRDIDLDAILLYKATSPQKGEIGINVNIDPKKLSFETVADKQQASYDVAGFVFDELGKLRGGFSETVNASLTPQEISQTGASGFTYSANTTLPAGVYQVRLAVRDNKTGNIGTLSRYLEVPDLSNGKLAASSLLIGGVPPNSPVTANTKPIPASRQLSRKQDLRYATIIYNAKLKDGKPQVHTQVIISQNGKVIFKEPEQPLEVGASNLSSVIKVGQLALEAAKPGAYTLTLVITDTLADKKAQTITRNMDFIVK